jgi:hypothetical protein
MLNLKKTKKNNKKILFLFKRLSFKNDKKKQIFLFFLHTLIIFKSIFYGHFENIITKFEKILLREILMFF